MHEAVDCELKLLLIGNSCEFAGLPVFRMSHSHVPAGVGKSSLLLRFSDDEFSSSFKSTVGMDFKVKIEELQGKRVRMRVCVHYFARNVYNLPSLCGTDGCICEAAAFSQLLLPCGHAVYFSLIYVW